jgi:hypothetical protein
MIFHGYSGWFSGKIVHTKIKNYEILNLIIIIRGLSRPKNPKMTAPVRIWIFLIVVILAGCSTFRDAPKFAFSDGYYKVYLKGSKPTKVYVENEDDSIAIFLLRKRGNNYEVNPLSRHVLVLKKVRDDSLFRNATFVHPSFDFDFQTIPFIYRPPSEGFPRQFSSNFNGVLYLGYRRDIYNIKYNRLIMGKYKRQITHYGYSMGGFSGLGSTAMNPWVTNNSISIEYDGLVWMKGFSFIMGVQNFSLGVALGWDNLLDENHRYWIYQGKPWIGLALGLHLN